MMAYKTFTSISELTEWYNEQWFKPTVYAIVKDKEYSYVLIYNNNY